MNTLPEPHHVRVEALRNFHGALIHALTERCPQAGPPAGLAAAGLSLQCEQCGIQITGHEWLAVIQATDSATLDDARLSRLHQGYCGRKDCTSYYYRVVFTGVPGVDWAKVLEHATREVPLEPAGAPPVAPLTPKALLRRRTALRLTLGAAIIVVLLVIRRLWTGGSIPLIRPATKYEVDPASTLPPTPPAK